MKKSTVLVSVLATGASAWAQTAPDILAYEIPADAIKWQRSTPNPYIVTQRYHLRNPDGTRGNLVGVEYYYDAIDVEGDEKLIKRELYKKDPTKRLISDRLHGVKREWHRNGQLKSEQPYRMNVMDGLFRHWDEQGRLVGQYQMNNGSGIRKIYNSEGQLLEEEHYRNNRKDGLNFEFYPRSKYVFGWLKQGEYQGLTFQFLGVRPFHLRSFNTKGWLHGPSLGFDLRNEEEKKNPDLGNGFAYAGESRKWYVNNKSVDEEEYAKTAEQDKTLPPYFQDIEQYKQFVTPEVTTLAEKYRTMPRVKIPLEFDDKGEPIAAPPAPLVPLQEKAP